MKLDIEIKKVIKRTLALTNRYDAMTMDTYLLGNIPELDSVSIVSIILALEKEFSISIHDDEISAATFKTLGTLVQFIQKKITEKTTTTTAV
ncbi:acyl carrier protein [Nitrosomonas sp. PY1]|uniref:phosphopantetheine-binding protein n=1 Tax=Nitrosomonas sp. PY1 TaxID=1803906 RepID=UPI001FC8E022|nr:phosphopantetheine-binding protein [Nitrosomonas sp. PY1]GKS69400.1 acyl carrier protein [Nitrosomonas sp. PY1]